MTARAGGLPAPGLLDGEISEAQFEQDIGASLLNTGPDGTPTADGEIAEANCSD